MGNCNFVFSDQTDQMKQEKNQNYQQLYENEHKKCEDFIKKLNHYQVN
jgi:hypothetical protein